MAYYALKRLDKKGRKRERAKIEMARQTERVEENQCGRKIKHEDFWSAMSHADQLGRETGILYYVYHCDACGFGHVGHSEQPTITWMYGGYAETINTKLR